MNIRVNVKSLGSKRGSICGASFAMAQPPQTVEALIREAVLSCVAAYNERFRKAVAEPLSRQEMDGMGRVGKIAFGINYGSKPADEQQAVACALQAYEDGLFRIFIGERECGGQADAIDLKENDSVTFIRLTMLTGGLWP